MCKFWTWRRRRTREWTIGHHNWRMEMLPVFALAGNCYCKVIYYFHKFNVPLFIYLKNSKTYPRIGLFRKLPYPRIRILPIPIRVSVSVLHSLQPPQTMYFSSSKHHTNPHQQQADVEKLKKVSFNQFGSQTNSIFNYLYSISIPK